MKRMIFFGIISVVFIILVVGGIIMLSPSNVNPASIAVTNIKISDDNINFNGTFTNSSLQFKGYTVKYEDETLYINIKSGLISFSKQKDIDISIKNTYGKVKKIYLQGKTISDNVLIYSEK